MSPRQTLSLCMITLNEERCIARALANVRPYVDELVVVDGGSTDRTCWIAEAFGARVIHRAWNEHFAEQRNFSLAHTASDWILVLDADEVFDTRLLEQLRRLIANNIDIDAFAFTRLNYLDGAMVKDRPNILIRLFVNNGRISFTGRVHEYVVGHTFSATPPNCYILHAKPKDRQIRQNAYYDSLIAKYHLSSVAT